LSEPERDKHIWISVVEIAGGADRCWKHIPNANQSRLNRVVRRLAVDSIAW
jgi:hypothetical protein